MLPRRVGDNFQYTTRGSMRDKITIMMPNPNTADDGSPLPLVVFKANVWAYVRALRSQLVNAPELLQSESYFDVRIPYIDGVLSTFTVTAPDGGDWLIVSVNDPDQRRVELRMLCREINDGKLGISA